MNVTLELFLVAAPFVVVKAFQMHITAKSAFRLKKTEMDALKL
jgi:hypothetical protein